MDIQSKVAARRAELDRQDKEAVAEARRIDKEVEQAKARQRADALDTIAVELFDEKAAVVRIGDALALEERQIPALDVDGLKKSQIESLLLREARKLWTAGENWQVIGCIIAGLCFIYIPVVTIVLLIVGFARRSTLNQKYKSVVRNRYPSIFGHPSTKLEILENVLS